MTDKQLEKLGIVPSGMQLRASRKYWINTLEIEIVIPKRFTIEDVLNLIYEAGKRFGIEQGKSIKIAEIKKALEVWD